MAKSAPIQNLLFYSGFISEIIPFLFCLFFYKKIITKALKIFFIYAVLLAFFSICSLLLLKIGEDRNTYFLLLRAFNICEFTFIGMFIYHLLKRAFLKKIILYSIPLFILYAVVDYALADTKQFNNHSNIVSAFLLILYLIYYFYDKMKTVLRYPLYESISFWICVGFFINYTGIFFFILFINSSTDKEFVVLMNSIYGIVTITKNVLLCVALFADERIDQEQDELQLPAQIDSNEFLPSGL